MQFYQFNSVISDKQWLTDNEIRELEKVHVRNINKCTTDFNRKFDGKACFFVKNIDENIINAGAIVPNKEFFVSHMDLFFKSFKFSIENISCYEEITTDQIGNDLNFACRNDFTDFNDGVLSDFSIPSNRGRFGFNICFAENMLNGISESSAISLCDKYITKETLLPEFKRIFTPPITDNAAGNPVHYMLFCDDRDRRREIYKSILNALYENHRIENRRYCYMDIDQYDNISSEDLESLYKCNIGGSIVIRYRGSNEEDTNYAASERENIQKISELVYKYRNQVLTIICLPRESTRTKGRFYDALGKICFVEIREDFAEYEESKKYLKEIAKERGVKTDKELFAVLKENQSYLASDLTKIFDEWFDVKLRTAIYPQYADMKYATPEEKEKKVKGSAYKELMSMVGLDEAKKVINEALDYYKAQKIFKDKGIKMSKPTMHMVFLGSPGSCKTTVARLMAEIFKDNGILSKGDLIEVSRKDLVGKYVGWSAQLTKDICKRSKGNLLFIDEAYSLLDGYENSFGTEVLNTLCAELENNRDDMIVVFAGYKDKMEQMLAVNEGLRSRIAFHVPFADYNPDELCSIAQYMCKEQDMKLSDDAIDKLHVMCEAAVKQPDFGNGRFVRNVLEKARMTQAGRLLRLGYDNVTRDDVALLTADDIEMPVSIFTDKKTNIGFCA